jgi:putative SOS response-associated peptidase YedK
MDLAESHDRGLTGTTPGHFRVRNWLTVGGSFAIMCGRYVQLLPAEAIARLFGTRNPVVNIAPSWNIAPTQDALVVRRHPKSGDRHLDLLSWGLVPHFTQGMKNADRPINARAEAAAKSRMFRDALEKRRCLIPADAFYEWQSTPTGKQPYAVARQDRQTMALAGLWEGWRSPAGEVLRTFVILTTTANETVRQLHERMPVVLEPADWPVWLGEAEGDPMGLLRPPGNDVLEFWPVGRAVNNVKNNNPQLLAPLGAPT